MNYLTKIFLKNSPLFFGKKNIFFPRAYMDCDGKLYDNLDEYYRVKFGYPVHKRYYSENEKIYCVYCFKEIDRHNGCYVCQIEEGHSHY